MLSDALNDAGLDIQATLSKPLEIPWSEKTVKELIWRRVQEAQTGKHSTTELDAPEVNAVYQTIARHMAQTHGINVPFPNKDEDA